MGQDTSFGFSPQTMLSPAIGRYDVRFPVTKTPWSSEAASGLQFIQRRPL